jgi:hypothetical protein
LLLYNHILESTNHKSWSPWSILKIKKHTMAARRNPAKMDLGVCHSGYKKNNQKKHRLKLRKFNIVISNPQKNIETYILYHYIHLYT